MINWIKAVDSKPPEMTEVLACDDTGYVFVCWWDGTNWIHQHELTDDVEFWLKPSDLELPVKRSEWVELNQC